MPRLTDKTELTQAPDNSDLVHVVDTSDTTGSPQGTSKKVQMSNLTQFTDSAGKIVPRGSKDLDMGANNASATDVTATNDLSGNTVAATTSVTGVTVEGTTSMETPTMNVTTQLNVATNTEIKESSGDTVIENTSATKSIFLKLGEALGATFVKIVDSAGTVLGSISSLGEWLLGKAGTAGVFAVRDSSDVEQEILYAEQDNQGKGIYTMRKKVTLTTLSTIELPDATRGTIIYITVGDTTDSISQGDIYVDGTFNIAAKGTVALTDIGSTLAIYTSGTQVILRNRYATTKTIGIRYEYF